MALGMNETDAVIEFIQEELDRDANDFSKVPERNGFTEAYEWNWASISEYMKDNNHSINKVVTAFWYKETKGMTDRELEGMGWQ